ncbi:MAG: bifunctional phosphopantothenoylcysteine decarboxylase/phosphopantothenate--cysteine ligase CoaBC [Oxalobacteraceae bacterium]
MNLAGKKIVLGLTGGIACYKAAELARGLVKAGASVQVVMTEASRRFITPVTMQALSGKPVYTDQWDSRISNNMAHIDLSRDADAILIAPCSADFMRKLVHGAADDLLSTLCLARPSTVPLLVAPAMNVEMWENPATQRNAEQLRNDGVSLLGPVAGDQACGETGLGRMMEPEQLLEDLSAFFQPKLLTGKKVMITAGPTFEPIDPVRGITNLSSGKMGYAIARAARAAGAEVTLVSGPTALSRPSGVVLLPVTTAREMHEAVISHIATQDLFIAVAAVADWRVASVSEQKIKKQEGQTPSLQFEQNPDILAAVAALPSPPYCVGFAAESDDLLAHGAAKREKKRIPLLVGNIGPQTFGKDDNELVLFDEQGHHRLPRASKDSLAQTLITEIAQRLPLKK